MDRIQIKEKSKFDLGSSIFNSVWLMAVVVMLIYGVLQGLGVSGGNSVDIEDLREIDSQVAIIVATRNLISSLIGLVISIVLLPLGYGLVKVFLSVTRGKGVKVENLFAGYKENWKQNALTSFMSGLYTFLWALLFIIPGIVKGYSYSMALYLRNDHPEYDWKTAIAESREWMDGHKMELFILDLSFIGWYIVGALCLGIGTLWVEAYHQTARANFYNSLVSYREQPTITIEIDS